MGDIYLRAAPFQALGHHDDRFMRTAGLFAFARRRRLGVYEVLHLQIAETISRIAVPGHPRWDWALEAGLDTLLVHLFGSRTDLAAATTSDLETVAWHPEARVDIADLPEPACALPSRLDRSVR